MKRSCETQVRHLPGAAVVELSGEVDGAAAAALTGAYEQAVSEGAPDTVVLDFAGVDYINSTGIALIVSVLAAPAPSGARWSHAGCHSTTARSSTSPGSRTSSSSTPTLTEP